MLLIGELLSDNSDGSSSVEFRIVKNKNVVYNMGNAIVYQEGIVVVDKDWII